MISRIHNVLLRLVRRRKHLLHSLLHLLQAFECDALQWHNLRSVSACVCIVTLEQKAFVRGDRTPARLTQRTFGLHSTSDKLPFSLYTRPALGRISCKLWFCWSPSSYIRTYMCVLCVCVVSSRSAALRRERDAETYHGGELCGTGEEPRLEFKLHRRRKKGSDKSGLGDPDLGWKKQFQAKGSYKVCC